MSRGKRALEIITDADRYREQAVSVLEGVLERARAGKVRAVMVLEEDDEGILTGAWSGCPSVVERVGQLELLKAQYMAHHREKG